MSVKKAFEPSALAPSKTPLPELPLAPVLRRSIWIVVSPFTRTSSLVASDSGLGTKVQKARLPSLEIAGRRSPIEQAPPFLPKLVNSEGAAGVPSGRMLTNFSFPSSAVHS